jgi:hypothetical protein
MRDTVRCNGDWTATPAYVGLLRVVNGLGACGYPRMFSVVGSLGGAIRMAPTMTHCGQRYPVPISAIASRDPFFRAQV